MNIYECELFGDADMGVWIKHSLCGEVELISTLMGGILWSQAHVCRPMIEREGWTFT